MEKDGRRNMRYRKADEKDARELATLRWEYRYDPDKGMPELGRDKFIDYCAEFLSAGFRNGEWTCWCAEDGGKIVGNIFIRRIRRVPKPDRLVSEMGYITNVYTTDRRRNEGIGGKLLEHVKEWALSEGIELLFLWPSQRAISFYERHGFGHDPDMLSWEKSMDIFDESDY